MNNFIDEASLLAGYMQPPNQGHLNFDVSSLISFQRCGMFVFYLGLLIQLQMKQFCRQSALTRTATCVLNKTNKHDGKKSHGTPKMISQTLLIEIL